MNTPVSRILPYWDRLLPYIVIRRPYTGKYGIVFRHFSGILEGLLYLVRASMECIACPISWNRFSTIPWLRRVGLSPLGGGKLQLIQMMGRWYEPSSSCLPPVYKKKGTENELNESLYSWSNIKTAFHSGSFVRPKRTLTTHAWSFWLRNKIWSISFFSVRLVPFKSWKFENLR